MNNTPNPIFREVQLLGKGGFGTVYEVKHKITGESFALKLIAVPNATSDEFIFNEVKILKELSHPNIIELLHSRILYSRLNDYLEIPPSFLFPNNYKILALRFELCDTDLSQILGNRSANDDLWNKKIFLQIVSGVQYLHSKNICHRDLKPGNVLMKGEVAKLADFGLAKGGVFSCDAAHTAQCGTPIYMPPEIWNGASYNKNVDIYSLGIILIEFYTDKTVFINWVNSWIKYRHAFDKPAPKLVTFGKKYSELMSKMIGQPRDRPSLLEIKNEIGNSSYAEYIERFIDNDYLTLAQTQVNLLCLDGGGIRGMVEAVILDEIEMRTKRKIKESFGWIAGTSTGGLLALYFGLGHTAKECLDLYKELKEYVFKLKEYKEIAETLNKGFNWNFFGENVISHTDNYEKVLKKTFGENTRMSAIKDVKIIITVTLADKDPLELIHYTNFDKTKDEFIWKVARATSAAPGYFRKFYIDDIGPLYDGGMTANNPTHTAIERIINWKQNKYVMNKPILQHVLSLGTGIMPVKLCPLPDLPTCDGLNNYWEYVKMFWAGDLNIIKNTLLNELTRTEGHIVDQAKAFCSLGNIGFQRFNPPLSEELELNETNDNKIDVMISDTYIYVKNKAEEFDKLIKILNEIGSKNQPSIASSCGIM